MKPRLLDLFCGAGGAAVGYHRAGFDVVGVDIKAQPSYPFEFVQADALELLANESWVYDEFAAVHASPPCQAFSSITRVSGSKHDDLLTPTRDILAGTGRPYVIENVMGAPLPSAIRLCGSAFGLGAVCDDGKRRQLRRHRLFESSMLVLSPPCQHEGEPIGVYGHGGGQKKTVWNGGTNRGYMGRLSECREAMGIDWMDKREISQAIPPAYTEFIGACLLDHIEAAAYDLMANSHGARFHSYKHRGR